VLLERTLLLLYGCCSLLDPDLNPVAIIQPYLRDFVLGNRDFAQIAMEAIREMAMGAMTLPEDMRRYLVRANRGELAVHVRGVQEGARTIYTAARQLIYTAVGLVAMVQALQSWRLREMGMARVLFGTAIGAATLLVASSVFSRPSSRR
jgi:predicted unusual protein kinase regulating ubiquinone biosynthesis (AarF/ABC1/UbiB family)